MDSNRPIDPFLFDHQIGPLQFYIGAKLYPFSIRDQMVRGSLVARRLYRDHVIGPDDPLLVVGAGVSGVSTAMVAVGDYQVPTTIVDEMPHPFMKQRSCATRWIDPWQYDWPFPQWVG